MALLTICKFIAAYIAHDLTCPHHVCASSFFLFVGYFQSFRISINLIQDSGKSVEVASAFSNFHPIFWWLFSLNVALCMPTVSWGSDWWNKLLVTLFFIMASNYDFFCRTDYKDWFPPGNKISCRRSHHHHQPILAYFFTFAHNFFPKWISTRMILCLFIITLPGVYVLCVMTIVWTGNIRGTQSATWILRSSEIWFNRNKRNWRRCWKAL